jgi:hypothetical protein
VADDVVVGNNSLLNRIESQGIKMLALLNFKWVDNESLL